MIWKCVKLFFLSRIIFILLIIIPSNKFFVEEWDKSNSLIANLTNKKIKIKNLEIFEEKETNSILNFEDLPFIERNLLKFLKMFYVYDSAHFINLAKNGYNNEKNLVFFPIFPIILQYFERISNFKFFFSFENEFTSYLLCGFIISNLICFFNSFLLVR